MSELRGEGVRLRRAGPEDVPYLAALLAREEVEPFLAPVSARAPAELAVELARLEGEPEHGGRFLLEVDEGGGWRPAGTLAFEVASRHSRIAGLYAVAIDPAHRGRGLGERAVRLLVRHLVRDLGYHRVQLEAYAFNEPALRLFEGAGFTREGTRRRAYWRHGAWRDGALFGLLEDEVGPR